MWHFSYSNSNNVSKICTNTLVHKIVYKGKIMLDSEVQFQKLLFLKVCESCRSHRESKIFCIMELYEYIIIIKQQFS